METKQLENTDLILLILAAPTSMPSLKNKICGITRLEKMIFLLQEETDISQVLAELFTFEPYDFGPYSSQIYDSIELLKSLDFVREERVHTGSSFDLLETRSFTVPEGVDEEAYERNFILTERGKKVANLLITRLSEGQKEKFTSIKEKYGRLPLSQLIRYVYRTYPEFAERSKIRGRYLY